MSIYLYDESIMYMFRDVFDNCVFAPTDEAFRKSAQRRSDEDDEPTGEVKLPLISIWRENVSATPDQNWRQLRSGIRYGHEYDEVEETDDKENYIFLHALKMRIDYQIDIWATSRRLTDDLFTELVFWLMQSPKVQISKVMPDDYEDDFNFYLQLEDFTDNSDITSFRQEGRIYRITITSFIEDARIIKSTSKPTVLERDIDYISIDVLDDIKEV